MGNQVNMSKEHFVINVQLHRWWQEKTQIHRSTKRRHIFYLQEGKQQPL